MNVIRRVLRLKYGAEFRTDVETFVSREVVDAAIVRGRYELPPLSGTRYTAFVDPSGGSADSMTLAIGHFAGDAQDLSVLDAVREVRPPFSPESVVEEFAGLLRNYRIVTVVGDRYGGECRLNGFASTDRIPAGTEIGKRSVC